MPLRHTTEKRDHQNLRQLAQKAREERDRIRREGGGDKDDVTAKRDEIRKDRAKQRARDRNIARAALDKRPTHPQICPR
ncbi:SNW domain-containing protein 1-like isoform X2 [Aplysia californica]|uniref:SNW domain-containing protein 1-like isoform X2 n=1 Tax=Aplysia californica TaxID=6500 RepID=A0ABM1ABP9_APLCA|nr:SNW domain-containing protein 1-like isoform X2 [Aplysia californica]